MATPVIDALHERSQRPVIQQQTQRSPVIAQALLAQGMSPEPVDSFIETVGRLAQTWAGNRLQNEMLAEQEAEQAARADELSEIMAGMNLNPEQARLIGQLDPDAQIEALLPLFAGGDPFTLGPDQIRYDAAGNIIAQNVGSEGAGDEPNYDRFRNVPGVGLVDLDTQQVVLAGGDNPNEEPTDLQLYQFSAQQYIDRGEEPPTYDEWDLARKGRLGGIPSVGWNAVDSSFATEVYTPWVLEGGYADYLKQSDQLRDVINRFAEGENLTGPLIGITPNFILNVFNSGAVDAQEMVMEVAQRNLRAILGGQFAEREGEQLMARAYNRSQPDEVNARRVTALLQQIERAAEAKNAAVEWFNANGTMQGFTGTMPTMQDFFDAVDAVEPASFDPAARLQSQSQMPVFEPGRTYTVINGQIVPVPPQGGYGGNDPWQQLRGSP